MHLLSIFPDVLFLAPLSATILRVTAGLVFAHLAYLHYKNLRQVEGEVAMITGSIARIICGIYVVLEALIAVGLVFGAWTQLAALVGFILALKILIVRRSLHALAPLSRISYAMLAMICLSLILTGAGAFGFDYPL